MRPSRPRTAQLLSFIVRRFALASTKYVALIVIAIAVVACDGFLNTHRQRPMYEELWWSYLAEYDGTPGSTVVNLGLKKTVPIAGFTTLVVTGINYKSTQELRGLPSPDELDYLNRLSKKRLSVVEDVTDAVLAGSFSHHSERLDYIYVANGEQMKETLRDFYAKETPTLKPYINIKADPNWDVYLDFLYPNMPTMEFYRAQLRRLGIDVPKQ